MKRRARDVFVAIGVTVTLLCWHWNREIVQWAERMPDTLGENLPVLDRLFRFFGL